MPMPSDRCREVLITLRFNRHAQYQNSSDKINKRKPNSKEAYVHDETTRIRKHLNWLENSLTKQLIGVGTLEQ
jgi:hypothetical protein